MSGGLFVGDSGTTLIAGTIWDDYIIVTSGLGPGFSVNGDFGFDTLQVRGSADLSRGRISGVDRLEFAPLPGFPGQPVTVTLGASSIAGFADSFGAATVSGTSGDDTLVIRGEAGALADLTFWTFANWTPGAPEGGGGDRLVFAGSDGPDAVTLNPMVTSAYVTLGAGSDILTLTRSATPYTPDPTLLVPRPVVVADFQPGPGGDRLNLVPLTGFLAAAPFGLGYLRLTASGGDALVQIDPDGHADGFQTVAVLKGVDPFSLTQENLPGVAEPIRPWPLPDPITAPVRGGTVEGSPETDQLLGQNGDDILHGGPGSDYLDGRLGLNTAVYDGAYRQYRVAPGGASVAGGPEGGADILVNIQRLQFVDGYLATNINDTAAKVYRVYGATLGRAPDPVGLANWTHALNGGLNLQSVIDGFVGSMEFQSTYGALDNPGFLSVLYHNVLHRDSDESGLTNWLAFLGQGHSRAEVVRGFTESAEYVFTSLAAVQRGLWVQDSSAAQIARLYDTVLGRLADGPGLANWTHALQSGTSLLQATQGFIGSAEFQAVYGALGDDAFVQLLYRNTLHRYADLGGLNDWLNYLSAGHSRAEVVLGFSESAEHMANTAAHIDYGVWVA